MILRDSLRCYIVSFPSQREEVTYVDRVRAVCGMLKIGNAASIDHR